MRFHLITFVSAVSQLQKSDQNNHNKLLLNYRGEGIQIVLREETVLNQENLLLQQIVAFSYFKAYISLY